jgi:hypothetical protein
MLNWRSLRPSVLLTVFPSHLLGRREQRYRAQNPKKRSHVLSLFFPISWMWAWASFGEFDISASVSVNMVLLLPAGNILSFEKGIFNDRSLRDNGMGTVRRDSRGRGLSEKEP